MQNNISETFQIVVSIMAIVGGILFITFRKKIFNQQKKSLLLRDDYLGKQMNRSYEGMTGKYWNYISILAGLGVTIIGIIKLYELL